MSVPLLSPLTPDLEGQYWRCAGVNTALTVQENGVRVHLDHQARVLKARRVLDLTVAGSGGVADERKPDSGDMDREEGRPSEPEALHHPTVPPFAVIEQPPPPR